MDNYPENQYEQPARRGRGIAVLGAGSLALFVMVGRWTPQRVWGPMNWTMFPPRVWAIVGLAVAVTLCLVAALNRSAWSYAERAHVRRCSLFLGYMMFATFWSRAGGFAVEKAVLLGLILLAVVLCTKLVHDTGSETVRSFWMWMAVTTGLYALYTAQSGWLVARRGTATRTTPLAGGPNVFARLTGFLTITGINYGTRGGIWAWWYLPAALGIVLTIGSGSRGGLLAGLAGLLALAEARGVFRRRGILPAALVISVAVVIVMGTSFGDRVVRVFQQRVVHLAFEQRDDSGRVALYRQAWNIGLNEPFFGAGLGGFYAKNRVATYCHNLFLEAFSEGGIVGLALLSGVVFGGMRHLAADRKSDLGAVSWAAFVTLLVASQFSGDTFDSRFLFILPALRPPIQNPWSRAPMPTP
jgi:O-antigen ligase